MAAYAQEDIELVDSSCMRFDQIIGSIEEIILCDEFVKAQQNFLAEHCVVFDDKEENKLAYTSIFESYTQLVETLLEQRLERMVPNFSMEDFMKELKQKQNLEGEVFDILREYTDFSSFKDMMIDLNKSTGKNYENLMLNGFKINQQ